MRLFRTVLGFGLLVGFVACGDGEAPPEGGREGESCTARRDCAEGLGCFGGVCLMSAPTASDADASSQAGAVSSRGGEGESCAARRDCAEGLFCVDNRCESSLDAEDTIPPPPPRSTSASNRGESCTARNDCAEGLSCIGGTCRDDNIAIERTTKSCYRVECESDGDCCADFVPHENCAEYEANCETDPVFCNTFYRLCQCNLACEQELCVASAADCMSDEECLSAQTPFCVDGSCRQCAEDGQCPGSGQRCVEGVCQSACTRDENCPLFHSCEQGECVETGCGSDRECFFATRDPSSVCTDDGCIVPCTRDADCNREGEDPFQVCMDGQCRFIGCQNDEECRIVLGLFGTDDPADAVCR